MIADAGHDAGGHDQRIVQGSGELTDSLVMYPPNNRDVRASFRRSRSAQGFADPGRVCPLQPETPCPCVSPLAWWE